jgi:hypothetical protein
LEKEGVHFFKLHFNRMPKFVNVHVKTHGSVRFDPMAVRFPSKPTLETMQALSVVCQQFGGALESKLSLLEAFQLNVLLLKIHMTRAEIEVRLEAMDGADREVSGVTLFSTDIPALSFAQPFAPRLTEGMLTSLRREGYRVYIPPPGDPNHLARVTWAQGDAPHHASAWRVFAPTAALEPLHVDADLHPAAHRPDDDFESALIQDLRIDS